MSTHYAPEQTGNAPYVAGLAQGLADRGLDVSVLAGEPHYPGWEVFPASEWSDAERSGGPRVRRLKAYIPRSPSFPKRFGYEISHGVQFARAVDRDVDAIVLVTPALFAALVVRLRLALVKRRPAVLLWTQDLYSAGVAETPGSVSRLLARFIAALEGALVRSSDTVVVIHDRFQDYVVERLGVESRRAAVVRNWSHVAPADPAKVAEVRARLGWNVPGETVVLHAGNMGEKQGLENVVEAARWAEAEHRPVRFVLLGDGNQRRSLEALGEGCANLEFREPVAHEEYIDVLAAADVLLVNERPSLQDAAVPSKLTSYFATGRPVLAATNALSITSEEITASGAGRVVEPADPAGLVQAAQSICCEWTRSDALAGPAYVGARLSGEVAISKFWELIEAATCMRSTTGSHNPTREGNYIAT